MKDHLKKISQKIQMTKSQILTEEATKAAFVMPFITALGYDVFDPSEVVPEFVADIGLKQGERVDYAIIIEKQPRIFIECKSCNTDLNINNESQLLRYFNTTESAKFAILTNGIIYRFYTDLEKSNIMDSNFFLEVNLADFDRVNFKELEKFKKEYFNIEDIVKTADILKMLNAAKTVISSEMNTPSEELVKLIYKKISDGGTFTAAVKEKLTPIVKTAFDSLINEKVKTNLDNALSVMEERKNEIDQTLSSVQPTDNKNDIATTPEEREGFYIVRAIGSKISPVEKIVIRDAKSYCAVLFDDNNRKPIIRFHFNNLSNKRLSFFDSETEEIVAIQEISDIYKYSDRIVKTIEKYIQRKDEANS